MQPKPGPRPDPKKEPKEKKKIVEWVGRSQDELYAIDRETALGILHAIDDYLTTGIGDIKKLRPPRTELRLRVGDYRVIFRRTGPKAIQVMAVKHRREVYRQQ
jgi:mRNA-degrading endonuclease RelE of RelBE toxin-antitoxin system